MSERAMHVCVYGSSSKDTPQAYLDASFELGRLIAAAGHVCVNGAGAHGAMGALNRGLLQNGGRVIGVLHDSFVDGLVQDQAPGLELRIASGNTLEERKRLLHQPSDCFIALPGGVGTFEEIWEMASLEALDLFGVSRPCAFVNTKGFYSGFQAQLQRAHADGMLRRHPDKIARFFDTPAEALAYVVGAARQQHSRVNSPSKL